MVGSLLSSRRGFAVALFAFCVLLAIVHTWPLVLAPHRYSRVDNGDYQLNVWAISWFSHQITRDPLHVFDGNVFWPERRTLAYSEAMVVQGLMATPLVALGASPVLAFNLVMLAGFVLTAFCFGAVAYRWTGSRTAALVAASAAGFNAHLFTRLGHLQAMHVEFLAIVLLAVDLVFTQRRVRDALLLGVAFALQGLTSVYLMVFTTWAALFASGSRMITAVRGSRIRVSVLLATAAVVAIALLSPYLLTYLRLHEATSFARPASDNMMFAGSYADYLSTVGRLHFWWSERFAKSCASVNFPGVTVLVLVGMALGSQRVRKDQRAVMCLAVAVGCLLVSLVPRLPGYTHIHNLVPLFWAVRVQAHVGQVVLLALALLAGFGAWQLRVRWGSRRGGWALALLLVFLINAEVFRAPIPWRVFDGIPPIYDVLAAVPQAVVVELPAYDRGAVFGNARYMLNSTRYWHPLVNGYSGFTPESYRRTAADVRGFPDMRALERLRALSVTHVVIHEAAFVGHCGQTAFDSIARLGSLQEIAHEDDIRIYRFR